MKAKHVSNHRTSFQIDPAVKQTNKFPTAAQVHGQIDQWPLSERRRANLKASINVLTRAFGHPLEAIPMDPEALAQTFLNASPAQLGIKPSSLTAYQSNLRAILRHLDLIDRPRRTTTELPATWAALRDALPDQFLSMRLQTFMAYCADLGLEPVDVTETTLTAYLKHLQSRRLGRNPSAQLRAVVKAWQRAQGLIPTWPVQILTGPDLTKRYAAPLSAYPASLQREVDAFALRMRNPKANSLYNPDGPDNTLSKATVRMRITCIKYALAALLDAESPIESLTSLAVLVQPKNVQTIIDFHWKRAQRTVTHHLTAIADTLRILAKHVVRLPEAELATVIAITRNAKVKKQKKMSPKRERRIRQFDDPDKEAMVLHLPRRIMIDAEERLAAGKHREAAWLAAVALAIAIVLRCPMRIENLAALELGRHLVKLDGRARVWTHIMIEAEEVKNNEPIYWPVSPDLATLIDLYQRRFRIHLNNAGTCYLFPNRDHADRPRVSATLGNAISANIREFSGVEMTTHDFRAFAGVQVLTDNPHAINDLRMILGHKTTETTLAYYASIQPKLAAERHNALIDKKIAATKATANAMFAKSKRKTPTTGRTSRRKPT